jgi:GT2 family glycosyltransferase
LPTAVREFDLWNGGDRLDGLDGYERAFVLVRSRGRPIASVRLPVRNGKVAKGDIEAAMSPQDIWRAQVDRLHEQLGLSEPEPAVSISATVAICTRDRPDDLQRCLEGVSRLRPGSHEVLVVDNKPSDDRSMHVARRFPVRYVREDRPGLDHARNRAIAEARGEVIAFIDDDATPDPDWLHNLLANYRQPLVVAVTGLTMPFELECEAQEQVEEYASFSRGFQRRVFGGQNTNPLAVGRVGAGANMSFRRSVFEVVGGFDNALDAGTLTKSGGDHEMFTRVLRAGFRIVYEPSAVNWHRHRRTYAELKSAIYGYGVGAYAALTRALFVEGDLGAIAAAWAWFRHEQWSMLKAALRGKTRRMPPDLVFAELKGCLAGPWAYFRMRMRLRGEGAR